MNNFTDILDDHRISYHDSGSQTRRGWINFRCPHCQRDPYMGFNVSGRYVNCWNCGRQDLIQTMMLLLHRTHNECMEIGLKLPYTDIPMGCEKRGHLQLPEGIESLSEIHAEYLRDRKFNPKQVITDWGLQGIGQNGGLLRWRLFIPIVFRGEVVSWTTRAIGKKLPRYFSAKDEQSSIPFKNLLYGVDSCRNTIIITEGPLDAIAIGYGAASLLGQRCSPAQFEQITRFPRRLICFDNEKDAQIRGKKLANDLSPFGGMTYNICLETGKDAAEASKAEIANLRKGFLDNPFN